MKATVRDLEADDLFAVELILERWMRDEPDGPVRIDNVEEALGRMIVGIADTTMGYLVVQDEKGDVAGVGGFTTTGIDLTHATAFKRPAELINVYVAEDKVGNGYGTALVDELENRVREHDCTDLIIVSGSRNQDFGYPFWDSRYGKRHQTDPDFFGPGADRVVWVKNLETS